MWLNDLEHVCEKVPVDNLLLECKQQQLLILNQNGLIMKKLVSENRHINFFTFLMKQQETRKKISYM